MDIAARQVDIGVMRFRVDPGIPLDDLTIGMSVVIVFETRDDGFWAVEVRRPMGPWRWKAS